MAQRYEIIVFYVGGGHARASYCGRTAWALKTARKHLTHLHRKFVMTGVYKAVILAKYDGWFPCALQPITECQIPIDKYPCLTRKVTTTPLGAS